MTSFFSVPFSIVVFICFVMSSLPPFIPTLTEHQLLFRVGEKQRYRQFELWTVFKVTLAISPP